LSAQYLHRKYCREAALLTVHTKSLPPSQTLTLSVHNCVTPAGKWNKHVDAWDAVENNEFFSPEAWIFAFSQMFQVRADV
jgi:hypothetical protein